MVIIKVAGVDFSYDSIKVLDNVNLKVNTGETVGIIGPNGSGKTTLLRCMNGVLKPKIGSTYIDGEEISKLDAKTIAKKVGYVPQVERTDFPLTVFDMILMGRRPYVSWTLAKRDLEIVKGVIDLLGLRHLALRKIDELSGGELRKVIIARALVQEPKVLLLDEPTNHLDLRHQVDVLDLIRNLVGTKNISAVMAMHDLNLTIRYSDKIIMLNKGKVYAIGGKEILTKENISLVFGVDVEIAYDSSNIPIVIPKKKR